MSPTLRHAVVLLAAVAAVATTLSLGAWQLRRAEDKLSRQSLAAQRRALPALRNLQLPCTATAGAALAQRRVRLQGQWLADQTLILENRQMDGRPGFHVVTPLRVTEASCTAKIILVERGWLPRDPSDRTKVPPFDTPGGAVTVEGHWVPEVPRTYSLGKDPVAPSAAGPVILQNIDPGAWARQWGLDLLPGAVRQTAPGAVGTNAVLQRPALGLQRHWPEAASGVEKHRAYAAQWFAMAAIITGLYVWFELIRPLRRRSG